MNIIHAICTIARKLFKKRTPIVRIAKPEFDHTSTSFYRSISKMSYLAKIHHHLRQRKLAKYKRIVRMTDNIEHAYKACDRIDRLNNHTYKIKCPGSLSIDEYMEHQYASTYSSESDSEMSEIHDDISISTDVESPASSDPFASLSSRRSGMRPTE